MGAFRLPVSIHFTAIERICQEILISGGSMQCTVLSTAPSINNEFELLRSRINCTTATERRTIVDMAMVRNVIYAAVEHIDMATGEIQVLARVYVIDEYPRAKNNHQFHYKTFAEEMYPFHYQCPCNILDRLTPTQDAKANAWRARCRKHNVWREERRDAVKAIPAGSVLTFTESLSLGQQGTTQQLRVDNIGKRLFTVPDTNLRVRLHYSTLLKGEFTVTPHRESEQLSHAMGT
jgi:hypothetical protein